jgi:hypothetical protein
MLKLLDLMFSPLGRLAGVVAVCLALVGGFARQQQNKGAAKAVAKIERSNDHVVKKAAAAGAGVRDVRVHGPRDPYTLD